MFILDSDLIIVKCFQFLEIEIVKTSQDLEIQIHFI